MGCCVSSSPQPENPNSNNDDHHHTPDTNANRPHHPPSQPPAGRTAPIPHYTLAEIMEATNGFSFENIISEGGASREAGAKVLNSVYRGCLHSGQQIVVKRFSWDAWPDEEQFREQAIAVGRLRHRRLVNLIGYCCDEDERLLVAEFMPNDTLAKHLFNLKTETMEWSRRLRVACYVAQALEYCSDEGRTVYHDLTSYKVLFDETGNPCLSCFGLVKNIRDGISDNTNIAYIPPEYVEGLITFESVIFSFGNVLLFLLTGKQIPPDLALDKIRRNNMHTFMDSRVKGQYSIKEVVALVKLASQCLQYLPKDRPTIKQVIASLEQVQSNARDAGAPTNAMQGTQGQDKTSSKTQTKDKTLLMSRSSKQDKTSPIPQPTSLQMAEAVAIMDLPAIHQILVFEGYKGDATSRELTFRDSTQHMEEMLQTRWKGDLAFNSKDLKTAFECYSQFLDGAKVISPTVYVRRSLCYLMFDQPHDALRDAMQAQCIQQRINADWPIACYMQAVALSLLNRDIDSANKLKEATAIDEALDTLLKRMLSDTS
ncbi:serine/threonine-protein kinase BSK1-2-like [Dioscorea cayenensis subsp. rotundata]|uniref:Serine/threonine-protein kinase BSK1-2-like n=1 Tax=Dioscorea cayennensis subsp. rotundata TaxID=55577 RepID=A0AB40C712_DIOCR|nr:serine/threonine-protein kinase BSK1-2-like [Dioscorea cayenensis subsp. rotundata]